MIRIFLERLALLSALSAVVIALFWPHIEPIVSPLLYKFISRLIYALTGVKEGGAENLRLHSQRKSGIPDHPKFKGRTLRRLTSEKQVSW